jgi:putative transposase
MGSAGAGGLHAFVSPKRLSKMAAILKPSTLLYFHRALVKRKYRLLYSPRKHRRPGPKGPSRELIDAVVEMKRRNSRSGCRKIAAQILSAFGIEINKDVLRRILIQHYRPLPVAMALRGSAQLGTLRTASGASTCFAANHSA